MSIVQKNVQKNVYQLIEGMLDEGLPFVASYLQKVINRPIIITDKTGQIHYPDIIEISSRIDDLFIKLPPDIAEKEYYYQDVVRSLYYPINCSGTSTYVIVKNLPKNMIPQTISLLTEATLAIKCYFFNLTKIKKNQEKFENELKEYLTFKNSASINDIIKLSKENLDIDKHYFVEILELDEPDNNIVWPIILSSSRDYLKRTKSDIISIAYPNCLIFIVPDRHQNDTSMIGQNLSMLINSIKYHKAFKKNLNIITSIGLGQAYPLLDLRKSYSEARIALTLSKLIGKKNFVQAFSELGLFSLIFSQSIDTIKSYCLNKIGQLIEYDEKTNGELLPTLRILLDSSVNWKHTADALFIHVNTLHYRVEKIEKLLNVDLSHMENRVNLFTTIKIWDTLKIVGFLGN